MLVARNRTPATVTSKSARARSMARAASWKRPPNVSGRETLVTTSPSGGGQRQTTHHVPAKQQEERDRRQGREQRSSENERRYAVRELSLQSGQAGSDRPHPIRRGEDRSEEHTSELQSQFHLVCRLLLEKKKRKHDQDQFDFLHTKDGTVSCGRKST